MLTAAQKARFDNTSPFEDLDKVLHQKRGVIKAVYDFAVQGGAVGTLSLVDDNGDAATLPDNAIITMAYIDILTAFVSTGGAGTIALTTGQGAGDILAAVDADTLAGVVAGVPDGTVATMIKLTAERTLSLVIAGQAMTAGKLNCFLEFVLSD